MCSVVGRPTLAMTAPELVLTPSSPPRRPHSTPITPAAGEAGNACSGQCGRRALGHAVTGGIGPGLLRLAANEQQPAIAKHPFDAVFYGRMGVEQTRERFPHRGAEIHVAQFLGVAIGNHSRGLSDLV